ncbi:MAG: sigma-54-dependent Fis family transcriptional regulator, partial [Rhodospirillaceae bacterium]|nr:sigma-54-dependent Fis family transcriptional regulator [Rhodospirillaceae bacterium]
MRLLIIGNLDGQVAAATQIAIQRGAKVAHAGSMEIAMEHLRAGRGADMAMMEVDLDIKQFIQNLDQERISIPVVACGIETDATTAANAIRAGAKEYVPLPPDPVLIAAVLEAVTEDNQSMIFQDPAFVAVVGLADQVSKSEASILITGESGAGKELMARYVHDNSRRAQRQFISVNCAAIPENLLESELFGHEKGSFTGAIARRIGKFEEASGGTLLLDEISEMDPRLQAKLLRAIQEREIDRIGGTKPIKIDIRVIATSNRDLTEAVKEGSFREDLLFRLNVVNLRVPSLRERPNDINLLATHFAKKYAEANGMPDRPVADATINLLEGMHWQGNVRELENTIHRAVLLATGSEIAPEAIMSPDGQLPQSIPQPPGAGDIGQGDQNGQVALTGQSGASESALVGRTVAAVERDLIIDTLYHC